jgi:hypothetical protein
MIQIPMTPAQFDAAKAHLNEEYGVIVSGPAGKIDHDGCEVLYTFNGTMFTGTVTKKPFFISTAAAEEKLAAFLTPEAA